MHDRHLVLTPEKVVLSYEIAGLSARIYAHLVDLLIYGSLLWLASIPIGLSSIVSPGLSSVLMIPLFFSIFVYFILYEKLARGQTIGKKALRIRVVMTDGTPLTWHAAFWRNMLRAGDFLPGFYLVGFVTMFTNPRSQRIGDAVAGTMVVKAEVSNISFSWAPHRAGVHPLEKTVGDLHRMTIEEYQAIKRLCDRYPTLTNEEQISSIHQIWHPFASQHEITELQNVHPIYQMEAVVMKYGRIHKLV